MWPLAATTTRLATRNFSKNDSFFIVLVFELVQVDCVLSDYISLSLNSVKQLNLLDLDA
jgi:hypothetical protein